MIRMIVSDVDGTLLQNGETAISEEMLQMIRKLTDRGVLFAAASGRTYHDLKRLFAPVFGRMAFVCHDGALVMYRNCTLLKYAMQRNAAMELFDQMLEKTGCDGVVYGREHSFYLEKNKGFGDYLKSAFAEAAVEVKSVSETCEDFLKLGFYLKNQSEVLLKAVEELAPLGVRVAYTDDSWIELVAQSVHKGVAVRDFAKKYQVSMNQVMAFGDNDNDVELLKMAGESFAMTRGKQSAKNASGHVVDRVENELQKRYGLK